MVILGIDPGAAKSGIVVWDGQKVTAHKELENWEVLSSLYNGQHQEDRAYMAIERLRGYNIPAGNELIDTIEWYGRFIEAATFNKFFTQVIPIPRGEVLKHFDVQKGRGTDSGLRAALIDRIGPIGTRKEPGPCYGITSHCWSALAVAITAADKIAIQEV